MPSKSASTPTLHAKNQEIAAPHGVIAIHGAREHNLKNISLDIPRNTLTVITGLSGSGKSTLAFDTLYAEGHRRYVESLSAYARQFLDVSKKPDVDRIDGLSPAIAIDQKTTNRNPRSTVGTITEIHDYLRLLYAHIGQPHCPEHGIPIDMQTVSQMVDALMSWGEGTRLQILAPVVRNRKGEYKKDIQIWQKQGYTRLRINDIFYDITDVPELDKQKKHTIEVVVDRLVIRSENAARLADSLETALKLTEGLALAEVALKEDEKPTASTPAPRLFSAKHTCPVCGYAMPDLEPRLFSFNSPHGACATCEGLGELLYFDPALIVPDPSLTLRQGALHPWKSMPATGEYYLSALAAHYKFSLDVPYKNLPVDIKQILLHGSGEEALPFVFEGGKASYSTVKTYDGLVPILERRWRESANPMQRDDLNRYRSARPCPSCHGKRMNANALAVTVEGVHIADVSDMSITAALLHFKHMQQSLKGNKAAIAAPILKEIIGRLGFLEHVGLGYLSLSRTAGTLSGGESQRIRLASQIGSGLTGVLYVLDEPSIGLHQRDNDRLLETLRHLRDLGNTVLVVEHDEDAIRTADFIVDMGIGAGEHGGNVVAAGAIENIINCADSVTGAYLSGKRSIAIPKRRRPYDLERNALVVEDARGNNLKNVTAAFPLGVMTCVTGVSGSGKSTLVMDTLSRALSRELNGGGDLPAPHKALTGIEKVDKIIHIDQTPIGRTPRSNPATYTGIMDAVRTWFAALPEAKARGYAAGRFSFNVKGGRCEACEGDGMIRVEMHFLPDVYVPCEVCNGKRFNRETLEVQWRGKSIADVLDMSIEESYGFYESVPAVRNKLKTLLDVGLGYMRLGQSATTLSGGEAQRIKLAKELSKRSTGKTVYILDEPTTGLHFADIDLLLKALHRLVDEGNTLIIIEHNLDVIKTADYVLDIGPEGGNAGGTIVANGTPEDVARVAGSYTGKFLKTVLKK